MIRSSITVDNENANSPSTNETSKILPDKSLETQSVKGSDYYISKGGSASEVINIHVNSRGYSPSLIVLKKNTKAKFKFIVDELTGCNAYVVFPEYQGGLDLSKGQTETPELDISRDFHIRCGMGMLNADVRVLDNPEKADIKALQKEALSFAPSQVGGCCNIPAPGN